MSHHRAKIEAKKTRPCPRPAGWNASIVRIEGSHIPECKIDKAQQEAVFDSLNKLSLERQITTQPVALPKLTITKEKPIVASPVPMPVKAVVSPALPVVKPVAVVLAEVKAEKEDKDDDWVHLKSDTLWRVLCPTCGGPIEVSKDQVACSIFRHAVFLDGTPVPPHSSKSQLELYKLHKLMRGCGSPFKLVPTADGVGKMAILCDYV